MQMDIHEIMGRFYGELSSVAFAIGLLDAAARIGPQQEAQRFFQKVVATERDPAVRAHAQSLLAA